jgi:hypothetical protein
LEKREYSQDKNMHFERIIKKKYLMLVTSDMVFNEKHYLDDKRRLMTPLRTENTPMDDVGNIQSGDSIGAEWHRIHLFILLI